MRRFAMVVGLLCTTGCSTLSRGLGAVRDPETGEYETPKQETVYLVPVEDAMMMTRRILEEQRYDVLEKEGGLEMFTSAHEPGKNSRGSRTLERYYIKGERVGPRQAVVRVFRLRYDESQNVLEIPPQAMGARDAALFMDEEAHPFDANLVYKTAPTSRGTRIMADAGAFKEAPGIEGFQLVRGNRDVGIEHSLLERLEMVPSLEFVGGNTSIPAGAVVLQDWAPPGEGAQGPAPECGTPVEGAAPLLAQGQTVLLADPLGTRELPSAALRMLCEAASKGLPVTLALSLPSAEQPLLDKYIASAGTSEDAQELLRGSSFWRRVHQDGRSSRAMLWLVEQARRLRASGRAVSVLAFDTDKGQGNEREAQMARRLLDYRGQNAEAFLLVLTGGAHARTTNAGRGGGFEPLGMRLAQALTSVTALDVGFQRGTQYSCRYNVWDAVECNIFAISPTPEARQGSKVSEGVQMFSQRLEEGFHGRLFVGALSASPPALHANASAAASGAAPRPAPAR
jgi:hypothetical protein